MQYPTLRERARDEGGFTLIELLVVMIIIAILMAVAVPTFLKQKNTAVATKAKANIKNIVNALDSCAVAIPEGGYRSGALTCTTPGTITTQEPTLGPLLAANGGYAVTPLDNFQGYAVIATIQDGTDQMQFAEIHRGDGRLFKLCGRQLTPQATRSQPVPDSKTCTTGTW